MRKLNIEEIKIRVGKVNPNIKILSNEYINAKTKLRCKCKIDGFEWNARYDKLIEGHGCPMCSGNAKLTIEEIREKLKIINPNILILSNEYVNTKSKLKCKCLIDENEWEVSWNKLSCGIGCPVCSNKNRIEKLKLTMKEVEARLKEINPNVKIISNTYESAHKKLKCKCLIDNNEFLMSWHSLSQGQGCPVCGGTIKLTIEEVKEKIKQINPKMEVLSDEYINAKTKLKCRCLTHDTIVYTTWTSLKNGYGCEQCRTDKLEGKYIPGIAERNKNNWLKEEAEIYIIECWNGEEKFYKIGITEQGVKKRFRGSEKMLYVYKILKIIKTNKYDATYLEKELHKEHEDFKYTPKIKFGGYKECFLKINIDNIQNRMDVMM
jgi:uncharacterized protein YfkK (UPF0435 family)